MPLEAEEKRRIMVYGYAGGSKPEAKSIEYYNAEALKNHIRADKDLAGKFLVEAFHRFERVPEGYADLENADRAREAKRKLESADFILLTYAGSNLRRELAGWGLSRKVIRKDDLKGHWIKAFFKEITAAKKQ